MINRTDEYAFILIYSIAKGIAIENNTTTVVIPLLFLLRKIPKQKKKPRWKIPHWKYEEEIQIRALLVSTPVGSSLGERAHFSVGRE